MTTQERFWPKVDKRGSDECWNWLAGRHGTNGYGRFTLNGAKDQYAHRVSWIIAYGSIPDGLYICHRCDNRLCVNPAHLFLGTPADNMADMAQKGRRRGKHNGEDHVRSILTERDVQIIRMLSRIGCKNQEIADRYGVSNPAIWNVVNRRTWHHVSDLYPDWRVIP